MYSRKFTKFQEEKQESVAREPQPHVPAALPWALYSRRWAQEGGGAPAAAHTVGSAAVWEGQAAIGFYPAAPVTEAQCPVPTEAERCKALSTHPPLKPRGET